MAEQSLKDKTVKGTLWSGIENVAQYGVSFIVSIILARLLTPDDYGLIGIVAIFTTVCNTIIDGGFKDALIRKQTSSEDDYDTAFILNLSVSVILYILIFFAAPYISLFFGREELTLLTRVSSISIIIGAFAIIQRTILTKQIDFKTQTKVAIIASLVSGCVGIGMALMGFGVWSLVAQGLTVNAFRTLLLWQYNKWLPRFLFNKNSFRELFGFGWKMMVSGIIDSLWKQLYQVIVGKFYSPSTLGQYTRANDFSNLFSSNITNVVQRVTYPVLSNIQNEKERMVGAYRKVIKMTMFITAMSMFFLGAISEPLIYCLIGPKWHEASTYLPLICIAASMYPLQAINLNMLEVQGRSDLFLLLEIIKKIILLVPLFVGAFVSVMAMLYVNLLTTIICFFLNSHYSGKLLNYSSWDQVKDVTPLYLSATLISIPVFFIKFLPFTPWLQLPIQIVLGSTLFYIVNKWNKLDEYDEIKVLLTPMTERIKKIWKK